MDQKSRAAVGREPASLTRDGRRRPKRRVRAQGARLAARERRQVSPFANLALSDRFEIETLIEIFTGGCEILDASIGHEEVRRLLQPVSDSTVSIELLPFARRKHLLRFKRLVDIG